MDVVGDDEAVGRDRWRLDGWMMATSKNEKPKGKEVSP